MLKQKFESFWKVFVKNRVTKPKKLGEQLLILATAPCVSRYFEDPSIREKFKDYDLACVNYMISYSKDEVFKMKPKYFIMMDPCLYQEDGDMGDRPTYLDIAGILEQIDWDCYIVTNVLADFQVCNPHIQYLRISCFSSDYKKWKLPFFERNFIHMGCYNVIQGALFFAITFGYKNIAMMGCPYKPLTNYMTEEGLHIVEHKHYYDQETFEYTITNEELDRRKHGFLEELYRRAYKSSKCLWDIKLYAREKGCCITNYSEDSRIDAFSSGRL